jgi:hypothetical protein
MMIATVHSLGVMNLGWGIKSVCFPSTWQHIDAKETNSDQELACAVSLQTILSPCCCAYQAN